MDHQQVKGYNRGRSKDNKKKDHKSDNGFSNHRSSRYVGSSNHHFRGYQRFRGAIPTLPVLRYGPDNNFTEFAREIETYALREFGYLGRLFRDNQYYEPPAINEPGQALDTNNSSRGTRLRQTQDVDNVSDAAMMQYRESCKQRAKDISDMRNKRPALFATVWGQLSPESEEKIRQHNNWDEVETRDNPLALWTAISATHMLNAVGNQVIDRARARDEYVALKQKMDESLIRFKDRFDHALRACTSVGEALPAAQRQAVDFINRLDNARYGELKAQLTNNLHMGIGQYPDTLVAAYNLAAEFQVVKKVPSRGTHGPVESVFVVGAETLRGQTRGSKNKSVGGDVRVKGRNHQQKGNNKNKRNPQGMKCHLCGSPEHFVSSCPHIQQAANNLKQDEAVREDHEANLHEHQRDEILEHSLFTTFNSEIHPMESAIRQEQGYKQIEYLLYTTKSDIGPYDVLLDNQATKSVFHQRALFKCVLQSQVLCRFNGVGGAIETDQVGVLPYFGDVSYAPSAVANILSLSEVEEKYKVTYVQGKAFVVHVNDGVKFTFEKRKNGLYACNFLSVADTVRRLKYYSMVTTVQENESLYTKREVAAARKAKDFIREVGYPSTGEAIKLIKTGINNAPVTIQDLQRAEQIYGPSTEIIKGKLKSQKSLPINVHHLPRPIINEITLHVDIMFIFGEPYLISVGTPLGLTLVNKIDNRLILTVRKALDDMIRIYKAHKFEVLTVLSDGEGAVGKLIPEINRVGIQVNAASAGQHVPVVENKIKQVKERVRSHYHGLPYKLPKKLTPYLVYHCVQRLNIMPSNVRMDSISPREAFTGRRTDYNIDTRVAFGQYCQIESPHAVKNSMDPRSVGAIALHSTGNLQGSVKFYILSSKKIVTRDRWIKLPIPQEVIDHMNAMDTEEEQEMDEILTEDLPAHETDIVRPSTMYTGGIPDSVEQVPRVLATDEDSNVQAEVVNADQQHSTVNENQTAKEREPYYPLHQYNTRSRVSFSPHLLQQTSRNEAHCLHISVQKAMKTNSESTMNAVEKEIKQMLDKKVFKPVRYKDIPLAYRCKTIRTFMFMKEKYRPDGTFDKMKARLVAGGNEQDLEMIGDVSSPTVSLSSLLMILALAKKEEREVASTDVPGAYLNAVMGKENPVYAWLDPVSTEIMCRLVPAFRKYVHSDGRMLVLLLKALYGCVESAKLWYELLSKCFAQYGMLPNKRDKCVFNKYIEDKGVQLTAVVYVDDIVITCANGKSIDGLINHLENSFGKLTTQKGKIHSYLGMTIDFNHSYGVALTMKRYEDEILKDYNVKGTASTPASQSLFKVDQNIEPLSKDKAKVFHSAVAKLLYLAKRTRPDLLTAIAFLSTRVSKSTYEDEEKLKRVLRYLNGNRGRAIVLEVGDELKVISFVDAGFGIHRDGKSQTGLEITLGRGPVFTASWKQVLVTKHSTEAELVGFSDSMGQIIWTREFLIEQGYKIGPAIVYQDNKSTMALIAKGEASSKGTRHINIRYFFIKDRVKSNEIIIEHMPTEEMISDYLTKSLQGTAFRNKRNLLHNTKD